MGGRDTPGVGWAAGVERLAMLLDEAPPAPRPLAVVPIGPEAEDEAVALADRLRRAGFAVELGFSGSLKKRMSRANKLNARAAVILGEDELAKGTATVRDMDSGEEAEVPLSELDGRLDAFR